MTTFVKKLSQLQITLIPKVRGIAQAEKKMQLLKESLLRCALKKNDMAENSATVASTGPITEPTDHLPNAKMRLASAGALQGQVTNA